MSDYPLNASLKTKNYKCFGAELQGFDRLMPINLIIGRNNSGKSALLDIVRFFVQPYDLNQNAHQKQTPEMYFTKSLTKSDIDACFSEGLSLGGIGNANQYGSRFVGKVINIRIDQKEGRKENAFIDISGDTLQDLAPFAHQYDFRRDLARRVKRPLSEVAFRKINAERDIRSEGAGGNLELRENGDGATNILRTWLTQDDKDASVVEGDLLDSLNEIFEPDGHFSRILVKSRADGHWEIYLEEIGKGLISLANSGSGLKTIILILLNTIIMPKQEGKNLSEYVFAFEELENNLHPALQRRLLRYLTNLQKETGCCILLTTHSSTTIDFFGKNDDAQIIHVRNNGTSATALPALDYKDNVGILDDLDVRASDILQSNGIIWVEGPSDRIYVNKWIELWSEGRLEEGIHYQCLMYGGRLLSHISSQNPDERSRGISILRANRNAIILMDSDKASESDSLNSTKQRIQSEMEKMQSLVWVTYGREIENYIPLSTLRTHFGNTSIAGPARFTKMPDYLKRASLSDNFDKVKFAEAIIDLLKKDEVGSVSDLRERLDELCAKIMSWNGLTT